jgi:hypothetical protein
MGLQPKRTALIVGSTPTCRHHSASVHLAVVTSTQRNGELIAGPLDD